MSHHANDIFCGDSAYTYNCTGDCVVGDAVCFSRAVFTGKYPRARFAGYELVIGKIIRDSYGEKRQQHTFTIELEDGSTTRIKGRNLYANGTYRKPWEDESQRGVAVEEKHERGNVARAAREQRRQSIVGVHH